jgi:ribosomal protein L11 methyltransferase
VNGTYRIWPALDIHPVSEVLQAALVDYDASAVDERSPDDWRVFFTSAEERDRAAAALRIEFPRVTFQPVDVPDENWAARSQASLRAVRVGTILVAPPWDVPEGALSDGRRAHTGTRPGANRAETLVVVIQPSMGFGTGHHATTRLCLDALQRIGVGGRTVIDVGTGSGVLAIAASLLGASRSLGIDDDADAIAAAGENLELNPRAEVTLMVADLRSADLGSADLVFANLTGGLLIASATILQGLAEGEGRLILSGLMATEEPDVLVAFTPWQIAHRAQEDEWVCLVLRREHPLPDVGAIL